MEYLVTGATGFIGKHLLDQLVRREGRIHVLVRPASHEKFLRLAAERWGRDAQRIALVNGDITLPGCGVADEDLKTLAGVGHIFHLAAVYDMQADMETSRRANVDGSRHVVELANRLGGATLHYVSSIAAAGRYRGVFREDMFDEAEDLAHPYFATKHEGEGVARRECRVPLRIYRPGIVIGSSVTGEADKIDGPYYAFKIIQKLRGALPPWMPLIGIEGARLQIVPVDFVARALDHIAHQPGLDGRCFHLVDPKPLSLGDTLNVFCRAAHAPRGTARLDNRGLDLFPRGLLQMAGRVPVVRGIRRDMLDFWGIPESVLEFADWRTKFDAREAEAALAGSGIACPPLKDYAWKIWDYWERRMDPDLFREQTLESVLRGRIVVVTGASSGIGEELARRVAAAGATPILVARTAEKLAAVQADIAAAGGKALVYPCDLSDAEATRAVAEKILAEQGRVDYLINNAGRSIRRSIGESYDRFHDFERTMQLNYFGSLRLILGFLPSMRERRFGHIINISSIGVQTNAPRFSAYVASKAALDSFSRSIASEVVNDHVHITTVYMPLVRTPMIAPTRIYDYFPAISPAQAADMVLTSVLTRQKRVATRLGTFGEVTYAVAPRVVDYVLGFGYRLFPESTRNGKAEGRPLPAESVAFAHLLKGIHW